MAIGGGNDDDGSSNPFVRFKHHVDSNVSFGFNTMIGHQRDPAPMHSEETSFQPSVEQALNLRPVLFTSYSPSALRHLPQPIPKDLPHYIDGNPFTFEDAFEDLLAVSQGQPLPEINQKVQQKKLLNQMFPQGEPFWFWHRRLRSSGLLGPQPSDRDYFGRRDWDNFHQELDRRAAETWGRTEFGPLDAVRAIGSIWEEVQRSAGDLEKKIKDQGGETRQHPGPDTYDEFFESIRSAYNSGQRTWDAFVKSIGENQPNSPDQTQVATQNNVIEDRNEYVDRFGYMHSKVTRKELDSEGNEVSSSTSYQVYPAPKEQRSEDQEGIEKIDSSEEERRKRAGWFWR